MGEGVEVAFKLYYILADLEDILVSFIERIILLFPVFGALDLIFVDIREDIVLHLQDLGELALEVGKLLVRLVKCRDVLQEVQFCHFDVVHNLEELSKKVLLSQTRSEF